MLAPPTVHISDAACMLCRFAVELDDIAVCGPHGRCICVRCYANALGTALPMPHTLECELRAVLRAVPVHNSPGPAA